MSRRYHWITAILFISLVSLSCLSSSLSVPTPTVTIYNPPDQETIPEVKPTMTSTPLSLPTIPPSPTAEIPPVSEQPIVEIPLNSPLDGTDAQISGLAWYGNLLVILPQYPSWFPNQNSSANLFTLSKKEIRDFLAGSSSAPLNAKPIPFKDGGISAVVTNFEGYEAIAFKDEKIYLTIEARRGDDWVGYIVSGSVEPDLAGIRLDPDTLTSIPQPVSSFNKSNEALVVAGNEIISLYEANGKTINPNPTAHLFDGQTLESEDIPLQNIEYRITDATPLDENSQFWALNIYWPGEIFLLTFEDPIADRFGKGPTHAETSIVERLIKLEYSPGGITVVDQPPIYLELMNTDDTRNWEGLALLDDLGFLIATDEFPETILAFVSNP